jgi:folate-binding protein YgfZ
MGSLHTRTPLEDGRAFVDLAGRRVVEVTGADGPAWLNDLVSSDVGSLEPGRTRRSLLLGRTGGVLAEFTVARSRDAWYLLQDRAQPDAIDRLLAPYQLSSDVDLHDRSGRLAILAFPGRRDAPIDGFASWSPSCLGEGIDVVGGAEDRDRLRRDALAGGFTLASTGEVETWRVAHGIARLGVDSREGDLPQECGLEDAVSFDKGCFVGQEAVAKTRHLGHPRRLLLRLVAERPVETGEPIRTVDGRDSGTVTSVAEVDGHHPLLARVAWRDRDESLQTGSGVVLRPRSDV